MRIRRTRFMLAIASLALLCVVRAAGVEGDVTGEPPTAISGCDLVRVEGQGPICQFAVPPTGGSSRELVLWIEDEDLVGPEARLHTPAGVRWLEVVEAKRIDGGARVVVAVEEGGVLEVGRPGTGRTWTVAVEPRPATPELDELQARWAAPAGPSELDHLLGRLQSIADTAPPWQAARAWDLRGDILRRTATPDDALAAYERAIAAAGADELSLRCSLLRKVSQLHLVDREDFRATEATHARMGECEELGLSHRHSQAFNLAELRFRRNDYRGAIGPLREAIAGAERLRMPRVGMAATALLADTFTRIQRFDAAEEALRTAGQLAQELGSDCEDDVALAARAAMLALERGLVQRVSDHEPLRRLVDTLLEGCARSGAVHGNTLLTIAYIEQVWHHDHEAERWLDRLRERPLTPIQRMFEASIRADLAMARGEWSSAAGFVDELARLMEEHPREPTPDLAVQRELVRGRVAVFHGDLALAEDHFREAIAWQDDLLRLVPLGLSASRVSAKLADAARHLVELQRNRGDAEGALCTARLLRNREARMLFDAARLMAQGHARYQRLEQDVRATEAAFLDIQAGGSTAELVAAANARDAAKDALVAALANASGFADHDPERLCDALPAPAKDEHALLFHQDVQGHWWLFDWSRDHAVSIRRLDLGDRPAADPQHLAERLGALMGDRLAHASRVRILASGAIHAVVLEALPWDGGTLEERFLVTWGLDLPRRPDLDLGHDLDHGGVLRPLVVMTDPREQFTAVELLEHELTATVERVWGALEPRFLLEGVTTADLRMLSRGALLIVLGHNSALDELDPRAIDNPKCPNEGLGRRSPAANPEDPPRGIWIDWTAFDLDTILTIVPPPLAILESCATGPADEPTLAGAVGLGHALVAAGTQQVLVTRKVVCATEALAFVTALVEAASHEPLDLPRLLRATRHADPDYLHRVIVP